jgi:hypothetical protein
MEMSDHLYTYAAISNGERTLENYLTGSRYSGYGHEKNCSNTPLQESNTGKVIMISIL